MCETTLAAELAREQQESARWAYIARTRLGQREDMARELAATIDDLTTVRGWLTDACVRAEWWESEAENRLDEVRALCEQLRLAHARIDHLADERANAGQVGR